MYTYSQGQHTMSRDGAVVSTTGHAGNGAGLNNPSLQYAHNLGPLPCGKYKISAWGTHAQLGPISAPLVPQMDVNGYAWLRGRGGFYIHGPEFSEGCIVQLEPDRLAMSQSGDCDLTVVE
jgi:hypothetical protein